MSERLQITAVGDGHVGKTCMLIRYTTNALPSGYEPTVFEMHVSKITVDNNEYNVQLWDTAGQEEYDRLRPLSYKNTDCFLLCYAVNSKDSYKNISTKWAPEIKHFKPKAPVILIGTKSDLRLHPEEDCLSHEAGIRLRQSIKARKYIECSSITREGIDNVFEEGLRAILARTDSKKKICNIL